MIKKTIMSLKVQSVTDIITNSSSETFMVEDYYDDYVWEFFENLEGAKDIAKERKRQIDQEGFDAAHDDQYRSSKPLIQAAMAYLESVMSDEEDKNIPKCWPWDEKYFKPTTKRTDLVKAGALIAAAIDYLDRN